MARPSAEAYAAITAANGWYLAQGVGCESFLPRVRFLCPPEVALIVLKQPIAKA